MTSLLLARIQFGVSVGLHYIYPITTLGVCLFIMIFETRYLWKRHESDRTLSDFLIKILGITFSLGVATGLLLPFSFGANWSRFSNFAASIFGTQLAIEAVTAFMLEGVFLGILIFGRKKVSPRLYWLSALMVFIGSHMSAFFIVSANSWMQTPAGYAIENGRAVMTSLFEVIFNPSFIVRYLHVVSATWLTGAVLVSAIAGYYILKKRSVDLSKRLMHAALIPFIFCALFQAILGHTHIMDVTKYQPIKSAAYEGIFETTKGAPLIVFGIPDQKNRKIHFKIEIPYMLSFLETWDFNGEVKGLEEYPESEWPPVNTVFTAFHVMVGLGSLMILLSLIGGFLYLKKKLFDTKWYLIALLVIVPFPYICNEVGWIGAEVGRQPWIVYGLLKTADANTTLISAGTMLGSLIMISLIYLFLLALYIFTLARIIKSGFDQPK